MKPLFHQVPMRIVKFLKQYRTPTSGHTIRYQYEKVVGNELVTVKKNAASVASIYVKTTSPYKEYWDLRHHIQNLEKEKGALFKRMNEVKNQRQALKVENDLLIVENSNIKKEFKVDLSKELSKQVSELKKENNLLSLRVGNLKHYEKINFEKFKVMEKTYDDQHRHTMDIIQSYKIGAENEIKLRHALNIEIKALHNWWPVRLALVVKRFFS